MCGFFTTDELDDLLFEASEVSRFLLEVEGTTLDIDEEIDIEDRITKVMRSVGEAAKTILKTRNEEIILPQYTDNLGSVESNTGQILDIQKETPPSEKETKLHTDILHEGTLLHKSPQSTEIISPGTQLEHATEIDHQEKLSDDNCECENPSRIIQVVGRSNSGKTTFIRNLIPELKKKGKVGVIKHLGDHEFGLEDGKDTTFFFEAGADISSGIDARKTVMVIHNNTLDETLHAYLTYGIDFTVIEGFKEQKYAKIVIGTLEINRCILKNPIIMEVINLLTALMIFCKKLNELNQKCQQ